ncbi:hypothetical protein Y697_05700 [Mesotoga sp. BH458_6_3_2_1]|nr:hypothetical protein Y697_05700 [Mesotoga sp. BH458_6_3_2_1]
MALRKRTCFGGRESLWQSDSKRNNGKSLRAKYLIKCPEVPSPIERRFILKRLRATGNFF